MAAIIREAAIKKYYENPSICLCCNKVIEVCEGQPPGVTRRKKFCGHSCRAKHFNSNRTGKTRKAKRDSTANTDTFRKDHMSSVTKGDLFSSRTNYQSARSAIQKHARKVFFKAHESARCAVCGYTAHVEVCHKTPVSEFPSNANVALDINREDNLIGLCPTHHWEFDNGLLNQLLAGEGIEPSTSDV